MNEKKAKGFGSRGWVLIVWIATGFLAYTAIGNYPLNVLSDLYGGQQVLSTLYTAASVIGVVVQLVASGFIGKLKSIKRLGAVFGILTILSLVGIMFVPGMVPGVPQKIWQAIYAFGTVISMMYGTFALSILVGQWFPTRKGSVMGIATFAFPIGQGMLGAFAAAAFAGGRPHVAQAFVPYLIIFAVGWILGVALVPDYPEEAGAFRDNDVNMTPEMARAIMEEEIENKKTTVWKLNHSLTTRDFWFITIPAGFLLMFSVGTMTQTNAILSQMGDGLNRFGGFAGVMVLVMICGLAGSFSLGLVDNKFGTKRAMLLACVIMLIAGILGAVSSPEKPGLLVGSMVCLALFMGASSNFTVSLAAQYWRREDFSTVFAAVNPIANLITAAGPMLIAILMIGFGYHMIFKVIAAAGIIAIVLMLLFSPGHIKEKDDRYREMAGKPLDDVLAHRK
ncbi:MAG: MFS transporter [Eubacterium sp.]|jgi:OFA family oxalate/formate antiporter-like MFS transporter